MEAQSGSRYMPAAEASMQPELSNLIELLESNITAIETMLIPIYRRAVPPSPASPPSSDRGTTAPQIVPNRHADQLEALVKRTSIIGDNTISTLAQHI